MFPRLCSPQSLPLPRQRPAALPPPPPPSLPPPRPQQQHQHQQRSIHHLNLPPTTAPTAGLRRNLRPTCETTTTPGPKDFLSHLAAVTAAAGPPFLPHFRFPFLFPRYPAEVNCSHTGPLLFPPPPLPPSAPPLPSPYTTLPPLSFPAQATFFTLADLDLCLYGNTGWLTSTSVTSSSSSSSNRTRSYAFTGLRTRSTGFRMGDTPDPGLINDTIPPLSVSQWRCSKTVPPVHDLPP
ncbi:hypothetical protein PoB_001926600, partial [Plakobranchus ocellatus]